MTNMDYIFSDYPTDEQHIATEYPFKSHYVNVLGSKMHYIDEGEGDIILFLHGLPAWSYTWRNIIPTLSQQGRCIAPDLIGLGRSDKPDIEYTIEDHINYIHHFIEALGLKKLTLVMHAWGSVIGFEYARSNEANIKALAFTEAHIRPTSSWKMVALPIQELASITQAPDKGYDAVMNQQFYMNTVLPNTILRKLSAEEMKFYQEPFLKPGSAKPLWQYLQEFPIGKPTAATVIINKYSHWLQKTQLPKLMLYAIPGYSTTIATVQWCRDNLSNLKLVDAGDGLHYPQEENPQIMTEELSNWLNEIIN